MLVRFGIFLGWLFNAAALICAAPAVMLYLNKPQMSEGDNFVVWLSLGVAGAVWLFGRGVRYVFVGPKHVSVAQQFVDRFADPNVPVRLPPSSPRRSDLP